MPAKHLLGKNATDKRNEAIKENKEAEGVSGRPAWHSASLTINLIDP
jgi:hypothetical protein